jgi:hypothetical protein
MVINNRCLIESGTEYSLYSLKEGPSNWRVDESSHALW